MREEQNMDRKTTTKLLSGLLEHYINPNNDTRIYWAKEVTFDYGTNHSVRVDYMRFKPVNNTVSGIEKGDFYCYEIKSSVEDFHSKNGHNFIGEYNYYVMPKDVYDTVQCEIPFGIGVIVLTQDKLTLIRKPHKKDRKRPVIEMLLMMFRSANRDRSAMCLTDIDIKEVIDVINHKEEVKHGYWTREPVFERDWDGGHTNYDEYTCSVCGYVEKYRGTEKCYHCGAIMDNYNG